jgi:transcriptional regulator with XRE-family HTH domain
MSVNNVGEAIRDLRLQRNLSQGDLGKRTGLFRDHVSRIENSHTIPSLETLDKIVGAMDLKLSQFFAVIEKAA